MILYRELLILSPELVPRDDRMSGSRELLKMSHVNKRSKADVLNFLGASGVTKRFLTRKLAEYEDPQQQIAELEADLAQLDNLEA